MDDLSNRDADFVRLESNRADLAPDWTGFIKCGEYLVRAGFLGNITLHYGQILDQTKLFLHIDRTLSRGASPVDCLIKLRRPGSMKPR